MNAEIYFPREGKSFVNTSDKAFENTIKRLNGINVNIIYKTEVNLTEKSLIDALKVTDSGNEQIGLVIIADGIQEDSIEKAQEFFKNIGVIEKVKRIEPENESEDESENNETSEPIDKKSRKIAEKKAREIEKLHKRQEKEFKKSQKKQSNVLTLIESNNDKNIEEVEEKKSFAFICEHNNKLILLLPEMDTTDEFNTELYNAVRTVINPEKKNGFWKRVIPCSGDRPVDVVRKIILMLAICTFIVSSYMLINILIVEPAQSDSTNQEIKNLFVSTTEGEGSNSSNGSNGQQSSGGVLTDFKKLLEVNPDTVGWITIPNTKVDYVVVKPSEDKDPEYYLYRDFYGNNTKYGTVFMDYRSNLDSKNLILHGHHMQDGRMFANITDYCDLDFYKKRPVFTFNTIYEKNQWKIIAVIKTSTLEKHGEFFNYLRGDFSTDYDFLNFIYDLKVRSIIDCPVDINENDTLVTLSTCGYDFEEFRFVVVARKVRDGESAGVDVSKADYSANPLYPDVWYSTYGGTPPKVTTFQEAYNKGEIDWYDGKKTDWSTEDDDLLARELKEAKPKTIKKLEEYASKKIYAEKEQKQVDKIVNDYTKKIKEAKDIGAMNNAYEAAVKQINKIKTAEQLIEESRLKEENSQKAAELKSRRESAIVEIKNSIAGNSYRSEESNRVKSIMDNYTNRINSSENTDEIESLKREAIDELSAIKTIADLEREESEAQESKRQESEAQRLEQELKDAKKSALKELNLWPLEDYYDEQRNEINSIIAKYKSDINNADSVSSVEKNLSSAKKELNNIKTKADIDGELKTTKENAIVEIQSYLNYDNYSPEQQAEIDTIIAKYSESINNAESIAEIYGYIGEAKVELDAISSSSSTESSQIDESTESTEQAE